MKLIVEMKCDKFPIKYQMLGSSFIKKMLEEESKEYLQNLYFYEGEKANKKPKNFCFGIRVFDYELKADEFIVRDKVVMVISSPDQEFIIRLYNGIIKSKEFCYKDYTLKIQKVYHKQHKHIQRTPVLLKTASPIWIKDKNNQSIEIEDPRYAIELNYICNEILEAYRGKGLIQELVLEPIDMRKKVVKQTVRAFSRNTNKDTYYTNCYEGVFKLAGNPLDLTDLLQLGIGFRRSSGYGMIEMV